MSSGKKRPSFRIGPGALVTAAFIGPGTITTCTLAGASFGYALLWGMVFSVAATIILQEMAARLGIISRNGLGEALRTHFSKPTAKILTAVLVVSAITIGNAAFQTPLATGHAFNGWADVFLVTPATGLQDLYVFAQVTLPKVEMPLKVVYHDFQADSGGADYGHEIDVLLKKKLGELSRHEGTKERRKRKEPTSGTPNSFRSFSFSFPGDAPPLVPDLSRVWRTSTRRFLPVRCRRTGDSPCRPE